MELYHINNFNVYRAFENTRLIIGPRKAFIFLIGPSSVNVSLYTLKVEIYRKQREKWPNKCYLGLDDSRKSPIAIASVHRGSLSDKKKFFLRSFCYYYRPKSIRAQS